jgi:hypothetical protein
MLIFLRRFLVLAVLMFWQGGFFFYSAVVVPLGQKVFGSGVQQGFLTRQVTDYMNLAGVIALVVLAWDVAAPDTPPARWYQSRWLPWLGMAITLGLLFWMHPLLDELLDPEAMEVLQPKLFRARHRWYLWTSTVQWAYGLVYLGLTVQAWRGQDRVKGAGQRTGEVCQAQGG